MPIVERIGVSLNQELLRQFDSLIDQQGYRNRSGAIRDLIRREISRDRLTDPKVKAIAVVCLIYDHHSAKIVEKLTCLQHSHIPKTICSMHIHLDADDCMEIIVLRGKVGEINKVAENMISQKGVRLGKVHLIDAEAGFKA